MVPALVQVGSDTDRCRPRPKTARKSQSLPGMGGGRRRRPKQKGAQANKSRYSWNCGDLQGGAFGRARFPGCADVVSLRLSHGLCE